MSALEQPGAGRRAIRGGVVRVGGYGVNLALTAIASVFLLRYLGVTAVGRYLSVMALVAIAQAVADAGIGLVGQRLYVLAAPGEERRGVLANVLGLRLLLAPVAVVAVTLVAIALGYDTELVVGTALAGAHLLMATVATGLTTPLAVDLRLAAVTAVETVRIVTLLAGFLLAAATGAGLTAFFAAHVPAGLAALVAAAALAGRTGRVRPAFVTPELLRLLRTVAPLAVTAVVTIVATRALVVATSVLASPTDTGLFATSSRLLEMVLAVPGLIAATAFPLLVLAAAEGGPRLADALQQLAEVGVLLATAAMVVLLLAPTVIVTLLGGQEFAAAGPILRIQCLGLLGSFLAQVWGHGLLAVGRQRALMVVNGSALIALLLAAGALIPPLGATGAAISSVVGETLLAACALLLLIRGHRNLRPHPARAARTLLAAVPALACALLPVPEAVRAAVGLALFAAAAMLLRAVPPDALRAVLPARAAR